MLDQLVGIRKQDALSQPVGLGKLGQQVKWHGLRIRGPIEKEPMEKEPMEKEPMEKEPMEKGKKD
jgi:hypothetical protein